MSIPVRRHDRLNDRVAVWLLAVILPVLSAFITDRITILHNIPFTLHVLAVIFVAMLGGIGPAVVAVVVSIFANYFILAGFHTAEPFSVSAMRSVSVMLIGVFVCVMNASRRKALAQLQERTDELILSQQGSRCASWRFEPRNGMRWQRGGFEVFGVSFDQLEKMGTPISLVHPDDQVRVQAAIDRMVATGGTLHIEYRVIFPSGELHWNEARGTPIPGNRAEWRGVTFDITDSKLAESALLRSEKLAAMGRMASTVAHEINNPLEAVTNLLYLARTDPDQGESTRAYLATAETELARLADITRLTLGFVRSSTEPREVDPAESIDEVLSIFRHRFETKHIQVDRHDEPGLAVYIAPHELRQICTNLISNACDAVKGDDARLAIRSSREGGQLVLRVEDNGSGISAVDMQRIFEPFFSTKSDVGTGIGLWVTRELVEKNGGDITVRSGDLENGMKTSFRVSFPLVGGRAV